MDRMPILVCVLLSTFAFSSRATEQFPDKIWVDGKKYDLLSQSPLANLLSRPDMATALSAAVMNNGPKSTGNWRGYVATWEIRGKRLLLRGLSLDGTTEKSRPIPLSTFFMGQVSPIDAVWYSGPLLVGKGTWVREEVFHKPDVDRFFKYGRTLRYESYLKIEVGNGYIQAREVYVPDDVPPSAQSTAERDPGETALSILFRLEICERALNQCDREKRAIPECRNSECPEINNFRYDFQYDPKRGTE